MGGPWFSVHENNGDWKLVDNIWISNGENDCKARVELHVKLGEMEPLHDQ
ncbi:MAG: hypothetical protein AB7K09_10975 [Planctomycetota bacterium]